jgi:preprotein translocase SecE subunit
MRHATPDAEIAEAQMALGRPDLAEGSELGIEPDLSGETEPDLSGETEPDELGDEEVFESVEDVADGTSANGGGHGGASVPPSGRGALAAPGPAAPGHRTRPGRRLITFLQGSWRELQRVQWPDRRQVVQATGVVIGFVIVAGVFLGVADALAGHVMNYVLTGKW